MTLTKEQARAYREKNRERIREYRRKWNAYNTEKNAEYSRKYRADGRDTIQVICECGRQVSRKSLTDHRKREIHFMCLRIKSSVY